MPEKVLPSPTAHDVFGNLEMSQVRQVDGRRLRRSKGLEQFNTWVRPGLREEIADLQRKMEAEAGRDFSRGEFIEMMFVAFQAARSGEAVKAVLERAQPPPAPKAVDRAAGRTIAMAFFATKVVADTLNSWVVRTGWTTGAIVEDLMARAGQRDRALAELAALRGGTGDAQRG